MSGNGDLQRQLAEAIDAERERQGLSVLQLARRSGIAQPNLRGILRGERQLGLQHAEALISTLRPRQDVKRAMLRAFRLGPYAG